MQRSTDLFSRYNIIIAGFTIIMICCVIICSKISAKRRGYIVHEQPKFMNILKHFSRTLPSHCYCVGYKVSPPQMPVPLKRMYNANIPRAEITTFVPSCPPMLHTIIKPKLSFFKNCFENGMLTSCVLSYAPMSVKRSILPRSPEIFLRPFPEKTQILLTTCVHPKISHNSYTSYHR